MKDIDIETLMMVVFVIALVISLWKIYVFLPKTRLADDDTTSDSIEELTALMLICITDSYEQGSELTDRLLYEQMISHESFDKGHYWRFNQNRLNHLVLSYYASNPGVNSFEQIFEAQKR